MFPCVVLHFKMWNMSHAVTFCFMFCSSEDLWDTEPYNSHGTWVNMIFLTNNLLVKCLTGEHESHFLTVRTGLCRSSLLSVQCTCGTTCMCYGRLTATCEKNRLISNCPPLYSYFQRGSTLTATNHDDQRRNLVKFIQQCREFGDFLNVRC